MPGGDALEAKDGETDAEESGEDSDVEGEGEEALLADGLEMAALDRTLGQLRAEAAAFEARALDLSRREEGLGLAERDSDADADADAGADLELELSPGRHDGEQAAMAAASEAEHEAGLKERAERLEVEDFGSADDAEVVGDDGSISSWGAVDADESAPAPEQGSSAAAVGPPPQSESERERAVLHARARRARRVEAELRARRGAALLTLVRALHVWSNGSGAVAAAAAGGDARSAGEGGAVGEASGTHALAPAALSSLFLAIGEALTGISQDVLAVAVEADSAAASASAAAARADDEDEDEDRADDESGSGEGGGESSRRRLRLWARARRARSVASVAAAGGPPLRGAQALAFAAFLEPGVRAALRAALAAQEGRDARAQPVQAAILAGARRAIAAWAETAQALDAAA
jgi:hypothetical protein